MMNCAVQLGKGPFLLLRHSALPAQWQAAQLVSRRCFASPARQPPSRRTYPVETLLRAAAEATEGSVQGPPQPVAPPAADNPFAQLGVDARLLEPLAAEGIADPTEVQTASIPEILKGGNVAMQCYTGSGKTLAYLLPVLSLAVQRSEAEWAAVTRKTAGSAGTVQAVVVAPSRELAMQILRVAQSVLPESARRAVQQCIGGANMERQREALREFKPIMVVGTPGRLAELSRDGALQTHRCGILVLDEVDQLLAPQFREEMVRVCEHTGKRVAEGRQTVLVSATLNEKVLTLCQSWAPDARPIFVGVRPPPDAEADTALPENAAAAGAAATGPSWGWGSPGASAFGGDLPPTRSSAGGFGTGDTAPAVAPNLRHMYVSCAPQHRVDILRRTIHALDAQRVLVFMNFQSRLKDTEAKLAARKMSVSSLHGDMTKQERRNALDAFKAGKYRALIVSDVAARGLDIPDCDAVVNLELPSDAAHYAHRAGRTGRAGRGGTVVSVVIGGEKFVVEKLGRRLGVEITEVALEGGQVAERPEEVRRDGGSSGGGARRRTRPGERSEGGTAESSEDSTA